MSEHRAAFESLPWLANGTLAGEERERLERHLESCADCRAELARCRELAAEIAAAEPPVPAPHPARFARLVERCVAPGVVREAPAPVAARGARRLFAATPRPVRWALAAQLLVGLGLAGALALSLGPRPAPVYRTLSDPAPVATASGTLVRVVLAGDLREADLRALLFAVEGEIAGGPSPAGTYTLRLAGVRDETDLGARLSRLRAAAGVRFAEPIAGGHVPPR
jgi:anti-sigma factor RsiW